MSIQFLILDNLERFQIEPPSSSYLSTIREGLKLSMQEASFMCGFATTRIWTFSETGRTVPGQGTVFTEIEKSGWELFLLRTNTHPYFKMLNRVTNETSVYIPTLELVNGRKQQVKIESPSPREISNARERANLTQINACLLTHLGPNKEIWTRYETGYLGSTYVDEKMNRISKDSIFSIKKVVAQSKINPSRWEIFLLKTDQHPENFLTFRIGRNNEHNNASTELNRNNTVNSSHDALYQVFNTGFSKRNNSDVYDFCERNRDNQYSVIRSKGNKARYIKLINETLEDYQLSKVDLLLAFNNEIILKGEQLEASINIFDAIKSLKLDILDVFKYSKNSRQKAKVKYSDIENGFHWSGRGKKPIWLIQELALGKTLEDFLIKDGEFK